MEEFILIRDLKRDSYTGFPLFFIKRCVSYLNFSSKKYLSVN